MTKEVINLLFKIKEEILKAKIEIGLEDQDNIGIKASVEDWNKLLQYIKDINED